MKKVAVVFVLAVLAPSLALAWLAFRSLQDQQFLLERQQSLLCQGVADATAKDVQDKLAEYQRQFGAHVTRLIGDSAPRDLARAFDDKLRHDWSLAQVGFVVSLSGELLSPSPYDRAEARNFLAENSRFLANRESAEVYSNPKQILTLGANNLPPPSASQPVEDAAKRLAFSKRKVTPEQPPSKTSAADDSSETISKFAASQAEFQQIVGDEMQGALARFVDNRLNVLFWCRSPREPQLIFGTQIRVRRLEQELRPLLAQASNPVLKKDICVALLDDLGQPAALSVAGFHAPWKRPFVATEIGELLPHWEVAIYPLNPAKLTRSARILKLTLGLFIGILVVAIATGGWLIVTDLRRQLTLARQKTDFVSNVSHELKTPLTSIRMFAELLAEGRVTDPPRQRSFLTVIIAESARLTRLINNVLDFARLERGEKEYTFRPCDLTALARETADSYRPHLEAKGFRFDCWLPEAPLYVKGDRDALAQVIVNLLSNAEKYSDNRKEVELRLSPCPSSPQEAELTVRDRGLGVPKGAETKIFEQFYRAHDSLSNGIQGSGLGLTLARQIARAHGGDVLYEPREGGGSCFALRLPRLPTEATPLAQKPAESEAA